MARQNLRLFRSKEKAEFLDEKQVIQYCLEGDSLAFESIVEKYRDRVFSIAYHLVLDSEDARDIAQQTFIKLWKSLPDYDTGKSLSGWICRIAANCAIDFLRIRKTAEPLMEVAIERYPLERNLDIRKIFLRIAPLLPERQRIVLVLREVNGMEMTEISQLLDCTESTVRNLLSQAKENFRKKVNELFPEYGM
jgi:RNA polymerase sigma-70 factor (ECF subfamily)